MENSSVTFNVAAQSVERALLAAQEEKLERGLLRGAYSRGIQGDEVKLGPEVS